MKGLWLGTQADVGELDVSVVAQLWVTRMNSSWKLQHMFEMDGLRGMPVVPAQPCSCGQRSGWGGGSLSVGQRLEGWDGFSSLAQGHGRVRRTLVKAGRSLELAVASVADAVRGLWLGH